MSVTNSPLGQATQSAPKTHNLRPPESKPPKNEKEVKHKLPTAAIQILKAVNAVSEAIDLVDALYKALPSSTVHGIGNLSMKNSVRTLMNEWKQ